MSPEQAPSGNSLGRNVSALFIAQLITWTFGLALVVIVPRYLGTVALGRLQVAEAFWYIAAAFAAFGTETVVTLEIARDRDHGGEVVGAAIGARILLLAAVSVVVAIVAVVIGGPGTGLMVAVGVGVWCLTIGETATAGLQGFEDLSLPARAGILAKFLNAVAIIGVLLLGGDILQVAIVMAAANTFYAVLMLRYLRRYTSFSWFGPFERIVKVMRQGLPFVFGTTTMVVYQSIDTLVISMLINDEQVGWYAAADRLMASSIFIPTGIMAALFPVLARLGAEDGQAAKQLVDEAFRSLMLLSIPIGIGIMVISRPFTPWLLGDDFAPSGQVFAVYGIVLMIMFGTILLGQYAIAIGRERFFFGLLGAVTVATIPLDIVLVPLMDRLYDNGAIGGAVAYVVTEGIILVVSIRVLIPELVNRVVLIRVAKAFAGAGIMAAVVYPIRELFIIVPVATGAAVYALVIVVLRTLDEREMGMIRQAAAKLPVGGRG